jgi:hypothetical protein
MRSFRLLTGIKKPGMSGAYDLLTAFHALLALQQ